MDNGFLEAIYQKDMDLTRADMCVLLCIYRHTIGYHKNECMITGVALARLTGFSRREIINVTGRLKAKGFIEITKIDGVNRYKIDGVEVAESVKCSSQTMRSTVHTESEPQFTQSEKYSSQDTIIKKNKRNSLKESGERELFIPVWFSDVWEAYPQRVGKGKLTAEDFIELDKHGFTSVMHAVKRYKRDHDAQGKSFWHDGNNFFKQAGIYVDYLDENYTGEPLDDDENESRRRRFEG